MLQQTPQRRAVQGVVLSTAYAVIVFGILFWLWVPGVVLLVKCSHRECPTSTHNTAAMLMIVTGVLTAAAYVLGCVMGCRQWHVEQRDYYDDVFTVQYDVPLLDSV